MATVAHQFTYINPTTGSKPDAEVQINEALSFEDNFAAIALAFGAALNDATAKDVFFCSGPLNLRSGVVLSKDDAFTTFQNINLDSGSAPTSWTIKHTIVVSVQAYIGKTPDVAVEHKDPIDITMNMTKYNRSFASLFDPFLQEQLDAQEIFMPTDTKFFLSPESSIDETTLEGQDAVSPGTKFSSAARDFEESFQTFQISLFATSERTVNFLTDAYDWFLALTTTEQVATVAGGVFFIINAVAVADPGLVGTALSGIPGAQIFANGANSLNFMTSEQALR
jgi:hypothetical protein